MTPIVLRCRQYALLGLLVATALAAGNILLGLHHHAYDTIDHGCVLCLLSHTSVLPFVYLGYAATTLHVLWNISTAHTHIRREFNGCILALRAPPGV